MRTIEYRIPELRAGWPEGPWDQEPDKVQWQDEATGYPCIARRNGVGAWCGYVGLPPSHPMHGRRGDEVDLDVHGGISFPGSYCEGGPEHHAICHVVEPGEPDRVWWVGFDCNHGLDYAPGWDSPCGGGRRVQPVGKVNYCDLTYVKEQCAHLAQQLRGLA